MEDTGVDLGNGRAGQGLRIKAAEDLVQGPAAQGVPQGRLEDLERDGGHLVLEALELVQDVGGHQIGTGGEELAQLDEGGPQLLQGLAEPGASALKDALLPAAEARPEPFQAQLLQEEPEPVPAQNLRHLAVPARQPAASCQRPRSEERRVGKEGRSRRSLYAL